MDRLEAKGYVSSWKGEPTGERGGRAKRHFRLEAEVYSVSSCDLSIESDGDLFWKVETELDQLALHGAQKKALALSRQQRKIS